MSSPRFFGLQPSSSAKASIDTSITQVAHPAFTSQGEEPLSQAHDCDPSQEYDNPFDLLQRTDEFSLHYAASTLEHAVKADTDWSAPGSTPCSPKIIERKEIN